MIIILILIQSKYRIVQQFSVYFSFLRFFDGDGDLLVPNKVRFGRMSSAESLETRTSVSNTFSLTLEPFGVDSTRIRLFLPRAVGGLETWAAA